MSPFTKDEMLTELRTIFLFEADHILLGHGPDAARHFIGFNATDPGKYCHLSPETVDLASFAIAGSFERGYEFAFRPSVLKKLGEHEVQDLTTFMLGTPKAGGIGSGGEVDKFMTPEGMCQRVADTVFARWKLEWDPVEVRGHTFTTREMALLAGMTEGAVRNALADKSENGLAPIPGSKNPVLVEHAEAYRWLTGRRGFVSSPDRPATDRFVTERLRNIQSAQALGQLVSELLLSVFGSMQKAQKKLDWAMAVFDEWIAGTQEFDEEWARAMAEAIELEVPLFAAKVLEVTLRRNLAPAMEEQ